MSKHTLILLFTLALAILSCKEAKKEDAVAQVYDQILTQKDLSEQIDNSLSPEDSLAVANGIIESWVKTQMLIAQAKRNLPDSLKDFTKELEAEKNSLLIYTYENEFINQRLDTTVLSSEISSYYENNSASFSLRDYILKYQYVQVSISNEEVDSRQLKKFMKDYASEGNEDDLTEYCSEIGGTFMSDTSNWVFFQDFLNKMPIEVYSIESFLKKQKFVEAESENFRYFVYISDYGLKNATSPLSLVEGKIKNLIVNRRKQTMLKDLRAELYQKAVRENKIKYY